MMRFQVARLLGCMLAISVATGSLALPVMAAEETTVLEESQENDESAGESSGAQEAAPENDAVKTEETASAEETAGTEEETAEETQEEHSGTAGETTETAAAAEGETEFGSAAGTTEEIAETEEISDTSEGLAEADPAGDIGVQTDPEDEADTADTSAETENAAAAEEESASEEISAADQTADAGSTEAAIADVAAAAVAEELNKEGTQSTAQAPEVELSAAAATLINGKTCTLTAKIAFTAATEEAFEAAQKAVLESVSWTADASGAVKVAQVGTAQVQKTGGEVISSAGSEAAAGVQETTPLNGTITQTVTIQALKTGAAHVTLSVGEATRDCAITVNPVPTVLGSVSNLVWRDTTVLGWNKVSNAGQYKIVLSVCEGTKAFSRTITTANASLDLEDYIVSLIKANKASLTGASYSVKATVQAVSTDTVHYSNGPVASAPGFRYLNSTYAEALSRNGWFKKGGEWYFYEAGVKQTGWFVYGNKKYFLYADGRMAHDCWVGTRYMKTGGEMARNEWVDNYKYYVDVSGKRIESVTFKSGRFVQTAKGWRYVRPNGKADFKNTWVTLYNRKYYFDSNGYIKVGFFNLNGKTYFTNYTGNITNGLGVLQKGWITVPSGSYWLDDSGAVTKSQWVDKSQYYVNASGKRLDWITYENLRNVNTTNRLGYYIYNSNAAPEQSIAGYESAYKNGNRIMVVNLRFTKDNVPVCFHDDTIAYARYKNGEEPATKPSVSKSTLSQLNGYDYGIEWGSQYKGTSALTLEAMAKWIAAHPDTELYIEVKADTMSATQISKAVAVLNKYKIVNNSSMIFATNSVSDTRAQRVHNAAPTLRIGITTGTVNNVALTQLASAKGANNEVFMWCWDTTALSAATVNKLRALNVQYECGTFENFSEILAYYSRGSAYVYNSGVETSGAVFHTLLRAATKHEAAKWEKTSQGWKYKFASGIYAKNRWVTTSGKNYYFMSNGIMKTGWLSVGGKMYYLGSDGAMVTGIQTINNQKYEFAANGTLVRKIQTAQWVKTTQGWKYKFANGTYASNGWVTISGRNYYFMSNGIMKTGWLSVGGKMYYLGTDGAMVTGTQTIRGQGYVFDSNGVMTSKIGTAQWVKTTQGWKYKYSNGTYAKNGWVTVEGKKYYFLSTGIMKTGWLSTGGKMYYLGTDGAMVTGNRTINKHVYQFDSNGVLVKKVS